MCFIFARLSLDTYEGGLTVMSAVIVLFAAWLAIMMLLRMVRERACSGPDVAALVYILGTLAVFVAVATRLLLDWPREVYFAIVFVKMVSVIAVTLWARIGMSHAPD